MKVSSNLIKKKFLEKKNLKIITGLNNFNLNDITKIVHSANLAQATYLDIAANPLILREVRKQTSLPICVSSISINDLYKCAVEGVDLIEIGNYDFFYQQRCFLSKQHILHLAKKTRNFFPSLDLCVTIPYILSLEEQIDLACQLEDIGVQILQTESLKLKVKNNIISLTELINLSMPVLSTTYALSKVVDIPIIASSGMNIVTASLATSYGASAIGMGYSVSNCNNKFSKYCYIKEVINSMMIKNKNSGYNRIKLMSSYNNTLI